MGRSTTLAGLFGFFSLVFFFWYPYDWKLIGVGSYMDPGSEDVEGGGCGASGARVKAGYGEPCDAFARACASFSAFDGRPRFLPVPGVDNVGLEVEVIIA